LGRIVGGRSGDKSNIGFNVRNDNEWDWLRSMLTIDKTKSPLDEVKVDGVVEKFEGPVMTVVHFLPRDHLDRGFDSTNTYDTHGNSIGEYLRSN
ncbi:hypothetical protein BJ878DRAFT_395723, partial [Calycina marina]